MGMEMARPIGPREVRITKVYTLEAGEFATKHDSTPNWKENRAPNTALGAFQLIIEAEAGTQIGNAATTYQLWIKAVCLTNPAVGTGNLDLLPDGPARAFNAAGLEWEYQASEDKYTRTWNIAFPTVALFFGQTPQVWQYYVSLIQPGAGVKTVACTASSEPFMLL